MASYRDRQGLLGGAGGSAVTKGNIASVKVLEHQETPGIADPAIERYVGYRSQRFPDVDLVMEQPYQQRN